MPIETPPPEWENSLWFVWFEQLKRRLNAVEERVDQLEAENRALREKLAEKLEIPTDQPK
jgi:hypothetical protein